MLGVSEKHGWCKYSRKRNAPEKATNSAWLIKPKTFKPFSISLATLCQKHSFDICVIYLIFWYKCFCFPKAHSPLSSRLDFVWLFNCVEIHMYVFDTFDRGKKVMFYQKELINVNVTCSLFKSVVLHNLHLTVWPSIICLITSLRFVNAPILKLHQMSKRTAQSAKNKNNKIK